MYFARRKTPVSALTLAARSMFRRLVLPEVLSFVSLRRISWHHPMLWIPDICNTNILDISNRIKVAYEH
jgi:hypothetical protein